MLIVKLTPKMIHLAFHWEHGLLEAHRWGPPSLGTFRMSFNDARMLIRHYTQIVNGTASWRNYDKDHTSALAAIKRITKELKKHGQSTGQKDGAHGPQS